MTEDDARAWLVSTRVVSRETLERLYAYEALVRKGQASQNLVSASTMPAFWSRHIVDSAQLVRLGRDGCWLDIGSGAGIPGLVTAILTGQPTLLVEPRARRAEFLCEVVEALDLTHVTVVASTVQKLVSGPVDNLTARAVAALPALVRMAAPFARDDTVWILPKGKTAQSELASLPPAWQGDWQLHESVTDPDSKILIGRNVKVTDKQ